MKLVASKTSPYARKIRVLLAEKQLAYDFIEEGARNAGTTVPRYNPLNKIPVLVTDDDVCLYDSSVIAEYLDPLGAPSFIPPFGIDRACVRRDEALGNGIADAGIAIFLERKRETARQDAAWIARQRSKVDAGIAALANELGGKAFLRGDALSLGDVSCACALLWLEFRLPEIAWRTQYAALERWIERLEARPSFAKTRPPA
ncbi:MAG: glutathione S-transferase N-terminal domain-containing protein [Betaproteobacteria bacterium]|nr:glutathione S-transferase N-terminal domain-containing protein [Betaproteobacteria bacterium]